MNGQTNTDAANKNQSTECELSRIVTIVIYEFRIFNLFSRKLYWKCNGEIQLVFCEIGHELKYSEYVADHEYERSRIPECLWYDQK